MAIITVILAAFLAAVPAAATPDAATVLDGRWKFAKMRYQDQLLDPPNPDLHIFFEFWGDGSDRLSWSRVGEKGFCDRRGKFAVGADRFTEVITWVNPANNPECGRDPDMQLGRETTNVYRIAEGRLEIDGNLGDETLTYIWERQSDGKSLPPARP